MLETLRTLLEIALPLFLIMDPVGNAAACLGLLRDYPPRRQRRILLREMCIALVITVLFAYLGEGLLSLLDIHQSTLRVAGGIILFIISLRMVFPGRHEIAERVQDPFIVPIAVPLIAGPSLLAAVMLYAHREGTGANVLLGGIGVAWAATALIMVAAPTLAKVLGDRGLRAAERLMGLILILLSVQMLEDGVRMFVQAL